MDAVLCMAAAHLHHLEPTKNEHHEAELQHFDYAVSSLRESLDKPITRHNSDALITAAFLICIQIWQSVDRDIPCIGTDDHYGLQNLLPFASGLKGVFLQTVGTRSEIWTKVAFYRPVIPIRACSDNTVFPSQLESSFEGLYDKLWPQTRDPDHFELYMRECKRLVPVLSLLKLSRCGVDISPLQSDVTRYIFTFPIMFSAEFIQLVKSGDRTVQIVLAHFYVAVSGLLPEKIWWAQRRTKHMLESLDPSFISDALEAVEIHES
jgi:hypothetical protein